VSDDRVKSMASALARFEPKPEARRPDWCGGALLKKFTRDGLAEDVRVPCNGTAIARCALCSRCVQTERENRVELRDRKGLRDLAKGKDRPKRGFSEASE
jgi:hypothetical protein